MKTKVQLQEKRYSYELDFIKAVAILLVIAFHYFGEVSSWHLQVIGSQWFFSYWQNFNWESVLKFIESYFYLGVNLFVIASGFGLYLSYLRAGKVFNFKDFFWKRLLRLIPGAILAMVILFLVKGLFLGSWSTQNWYLNIFPFLGGLNLFSDGWFYPPIDGEMWFLGLIVQLYLLYPFLIVLLKRLGTERFLILLLIVSVVFRVVYYFYLKDVVSTITYGLSVGRLFEFGFGMVVAQFFVEKRNLSKWWIMGLLLFWGYFFWWSYAFTDILMGIGLFILIWKVAQRLPFANSKVFKNISSQSYMMFLLHHPFIWILNGIGLRDTWTLLGVFVFILFFIFTYYLAAGCDLLLTFWQKPKLAH